MKKYLLLLTASLSLTVSFGQTSVYHPFPDSNAVWRWGCGGLGFGCCCSCSGICLTQTDYQDSIAGDTIIGSYTYKQIWESAVTKNYYTGQVTCAPWGYQTTVYSSSIYSYRGAIRQDTNQRKVFLYTGNNSDTLFYDFNLNLGDTLAPSAVGNSENYFVSKIDSILVGVNYHKRFWLWNKFNSPPTPADSGSVAYIEGIGNTYGLFSALFEPFESACGLTCVQVNSETVYPDSSYNCLPLDLTLSVTENMNNSFDLRVSPNPFNSQTTLQTAKPLKNASLTVYNFVGQTVKHVDNLSGQTVLFQRDNLPSGLYFVRLTQDGNTISADKFVITDR